jgi:hypothetical protein
LSVTKLAPDYNPNDETSANMAASALVEERELAINPIVATSVQHNNQVRASPPTP